MEQALPTTQKMVLVSLAHRINSKTGECFPSLKRIASDSGMTKMSVTRQIEKLESNGYLTVIRTVKNGEKQNNHYRLSVSGSNTELPPSNTELPVGSITELLPSNTELLVVVTESYDGSNRELHKQGIEQGNLTKKTTTTTESGSGNSDNLIYHSSLSVQEREAASKLLSRCNGEAQAILDTLSAAIQAKEIKKTPLNYLGGLVRRYEAGEFDPSGAISVAIDRTKKAAREGILQKQYVVSNEQVLKELEGLRKHTLEPVLLADKILDDAEKSEKMINFRKSLKIR
jgi:DNA-binding Lrp family transcriptional regulator